MHLDPSYVSLAYLVLRMYYFYFVGDWQTLCKSGSFVHRPRFRLLQTHLHIIQLSCRYWLVKISNVYWYLTCIDQYDSSKLLQKIEDISRYSSFWGIQFRPYFWSVIYSAQNRFFSFSLIIFAYVGAILHEHISISAGFDIRLISYLCRYYLTYVLQTSDIYQVLIQRKLDEID